MRYSMSESIPDWLKPPQPPQPQLSPARQLFLTLAAAQEHPRHYAKTVVEVIPAAHHILILNALEDGVMNDTWDDLLICTPPGSAKSTYVSHVFPSWYMGKFPHENIIIASHTATLAEKWSRKVRDTVASPIHMQVFPDSQLSKDSTAVSNWSTTKGGSCLAAGAGMAILGNRARMIFCDDLVSGWEQAQSITQLTKLQDWWASDLKSRMKPYAKRVIVNQRLSPNDIAGFVMKEHAKFPTRRLKVIILPMEADSEDDPLGRKPGDILWPEWYTPEMVADLKRDDLIWRTMWQQQPPSDDGSWVSGEEIKIVDIVPKDGNHYLLSDLALSVNTGDYSVHLMVRVTESRDIYIVEGWRDRVSPEITVDKHLDLIDAYGPMESLIDDDNAAKVYVHLLGAKARERGIPVPWKMLPMRGQDKETRAAPLRGWFKRGKVFLKRAPWNDWLVKELIAFPNALGQGVDDGVDALSLIGRRLGALSVISPEAEKKQQEFQNQVTLDGLWEQYDLDNPKGLELRMA